MKNKNVILYIDAANLVVGLKNLFGIEIDKYQLLLYFQERYRVNKCVYFTARIADLENEYLYLQNLGVEIVFKHLYLENGKTKANCDVEIAHRVTYDIENNLVDEIIFISGDGDFYSLLNYVKNNNKKLFLYGPDRKCTSKMLRNNSDFNLAYVTQIIEGFEKRKGLAGHVASERLLFVKDSITHSNKLSSSNIAPAFTLIELLVSISVLAMVAAISVSSYPKFSEQMGVSTESFKVLAYMREAQVYGSAGYTDPGVKVVYGLEIDRDTNTIKKVQWQNPNSSTNQNYVNNKVDTGELIQNIGDRFEIEKMCNIASGLSSCDTNENYNKVFVFFRRPNPEARLLGQVGTILYPDQNGTTGLQKIELHIRSKQNTAFVKKVVILQTGQMYVE